MSAPPASPPPPPPPSPVMRVLSVGLRVAVIILIVVAAAWLVNAYRGVAPTLTPAAKTKPLPDADDRGGDWLLESGGWSVGDTPWQVTRTTITNDELRGRLAGSGPAVPAGDPDPLEVDVVEWLKRSGKGGTPTADGTVYELTLNNTRLRGVITGDRLRFGQVAWPDGNRWQLMELVPTPGGTVAKAAPLLPLPAGAAVVARRWADGKRVVAELVGPVSPDTDTMSEWQKAGWSALPSAVGGALVPGERYTRGDAAREVWRLPGPPGGASQDFLLVFVPPNR